MSPATERPIHLVCPDCGYALDGVPTAGCPECGVHTRLAGRRRHMTRYARLLAPALVLGTLCAPLAPPVLALAIGAPTVVTASVTWAIDAAQPLIWLISLPIVLVNSLLLGWATLRPRDLFWLGSSTRDTLTAYVLSQLAITLGAVLASAAVLALR